MVKPIAYTHPSSRAFHANACPQSTGAHLTLGINLEEGTFFFVVRKSPAYAARQLWGYDAPVSELPALRSASDLAWGLWNCVNDQIGIKHVNAIWSIEITNPDTSRIINLAHQTYKPGGRTPPGKTMVWPGVWFDMASTEGQAILGTLLHISSGSHKVD